MSDLSQFMSGGSRIGDASLCIESGETIVRGPEIWLRSGSIASGVTYPNAGSVDALRVSGQIVFLPAGVTVTGIAGDGAGNWIAAYGDATNVLRSTDNGVSWVTIAHNAGGIITDVVYGNNIFVAIGNSTSAFIVSSSNATGSTWFLRTGSAITTATANTARIIWSGTQFVAICCGATVGAACTSTNGSTWTAQTTSQALVGGCSIAFNGTIYFASSTSGTTAVSSTNATAWTNRTMPGANLGRVVSNGSIFLIGNVTGSTYYTTSNAINFDARMLPAADLPAPRGMRISGVAWTGTYFVITSIPDTAGSNNGIMYYSANGIDGWKRRWLTASHSNSGAYWLPAGIGSILIMMPSGVTGLTALATNSFPTGADFVGSSIPYYAGESNVNNRASPVMYYRVK